MFKLSPSKLNLFLECPLCFWLEMHDECKRPAGIFPSLPSGMDLALKKYYDNYRGSLPPELAGKVEGVLLSGTELMNKFRNWRTFKFEEEDAIMYGAMDDCLAKGEVFIPLDFKTRGFALKEDSTDFYQNQLDCYALLLKKNGFKHSDHAYLVYYIPKQVKPKGVVDFDVVVKKMDIDSKRAYKTFRDAVKLLQGKKPDSNPGCEYCCYRNRKKEN